MVVVRVHRVRNHLLVFGAHYLELLAMAGNRHAVRVALRPVGTPNRLAGR